MIRTMVIGDSGAVMAGLTESLRKLDSLDIVRYASGRTPVGGLARSTSADVVLIHALLWPGTTLARIEEIRLNAPETAIVILAERMDAAWLGDALTAGADAILPAAAGDQTLQLVLREAVAAHLYPATGEPASLVA